MRQAGFSGEEFSKLAEAKANSNELIAAQLEAMRLAETTGSRAEASRAVANSLLYGYKYTHNKAATTKAIDEVYKLADKRTLNATLLWIEP